MNKKTHLLFVLIFSIISLTLRAQEEKIVTPVADSLMKIGIKKARKGLYKESFSDMDTAEKIYKKKLGERHKDVGYAYLYKGDVERRRGRYDSALIFYKNAENIFLEDEERNMRWVIPMYNGCAIIYQHLGKYEKSLKYYFEALRLTKKKYNESHFQVGYLYNNIGNAYYYKKDIPAAIEYYRLSKDILEKRFADNKSQLSNIYNNYGEMLQEDKRYEEAGEYFLKAIEVQEEEADNHSPILAKGYENLGFLELEKKEPQKAIPYFEKALRIMKYSLTNEAENEGVEDSRSCLYTLAFLAQAYSELFDKTQNEEYLVASETVIQSAFSHIEYITNSKEEGAIQEMKEETASIYEEAISTSLKWTGLEKEKIAKAFNYSELGRSSFLREAVQDQNARKYAGIPEAFLLREKKVKKTIGELEKKRYDEENGEDDRMKISALELKILELKEDRRKLIDTFEVQFPEYYSLKYETKVSTIEEVQSSVLKEGQTLVEYFVGQNLIFVFVINKEEVEVVTIKDDFSLNELVENMRKSIFDWRPMGEEADENLKIYQANAFELYQRLVAPIEDKLEDELIIIPGGVLGYLPFEALLSKKVQGDISFAEYDFWIKEKQISYNYSATLFKEMLKERNTGREVLAMAPQFEVIEGDTSSFDLPELRKLKYNEEEVTAIQELLGGLVLKGEDATLQAFRDIAPLYKILHLATHGKANDDESEYSYLAFSYLKDTLDNELLYTRDLYNMGLRADLVVLSACETGVGQLRSGEGITSIARGFSYAGAKSIVTTLWSVDDKASLDIMLGFYKNLERGNRKDYALRESKLDFIYDNNRRAHPLYWAGYVPIGNMESIAIGKGHTKLYWTLALISLGLMGGISVYRRRRRKKRA